MSATPFKNIALLGATGNLGSKILRALIDAGFNVTAIQRKSSDSTVPGTTKSIKVDYSSQSDLVSAFKGQDVVVSATPNPRLSGEKIWMDAAIAAGVKRIVPSEYSTNLEAKASQTLPIVKDKLEIRKYVQELASAGKIDWTSINNGPFCIPPLWTQGWMGPNVKTKTATFHDGGDKVVCTSTLERIGEGVAKVLSAEHAEATKNQPIYVYTAAVTERKITDIISKITGTEFETMDVSIDAVTKAAYEALEKGDTSKMMSFYIPFCFAEEYRGDFRYQAWNEKLGLPVLTDTELEETVRGWLKAYMGSGRAK
ncbi:isoflavone reductase family protein [Phlyctema vagabunda]|uniref:Isoflavone reductase family protein n=1 Tax=Phlyctema vagabunda TaxID=108571 RepID=A0ABR4PSI2_9HELO